MVPPIAGGDAPGAAREMPVTATRFTVPGMDDAHAARTVEAIAAGLHGVREARVMVGSATLLVDGDVRSGVVQEAVARAGFKAYLSGSSRPSSRRLWWRDGATLSAVAAVVLLVLAVAASAAGADARLLDGLYVMSMAIGGWPVIRLAAAALGARSLDMNVLVAAAAVGAVAISHYREGAWMLALCAVGSVLERAAFDRTHRSVEHLMDLAPGHAHLVGGDGVQTVAVEDVRAGDHVVVRPGERLPVDGVIVAGTSQVTSAPLSGESVARETQPGDRVYSGTLNDSGSLVIEVTASAGESAVAQVASLVAQAQHSKAPTMRLIDRFARVYTPAVFAVAALVAVGPILAGGDAHTWTYRALTFLILACPCALVISVPVAVVASIGGAARRGILIKSGQSLEDLAGARAVAMDKTNTLTEGRPELTTIITTGDISEDEALFLTATLQERCGHPLGAAILAEAAARQIQLGLVDDFVALPGRGASGTIGTRSLWIGGPRMAAAQDASLADAFAIIDRRGETAVLLGDEDHVLAVFGVADRLRPEAADAVGRLRAAGLSPVMLTGDSPSAAALVADRVGIRVWHAELLPAEKLEAIDSMSRVLGPTIMLGDGVNDAPALAGASVGVAMGTSGTDIARQCADVVLVGDQLGLLPDAIDHGRRAVRVMRQNIALALASKALFIALALTGTVSLIDAVVADVGLAVLVTTNGSRLLGRRPAWPKTTRATAGAQLNESHLLEGHEALYAPPNWKL